jgi:ribosomal protein S18 acetylase RimI-like enzyme
MSEQRLMQIRTFQPADEAAVVALWEQCHLTRPWNDPHKDVQRKLRVQSDWFLVGEVEGQIVATVMAGYDGHRGWIYYLGVDPENRGKGLGRSMMAQAEKLLRVAGCPKINLLVRSENDGVIGFYRSLGYAADPVVCLSKRLEHDEPLRE